MSDDRAADFLALHHGAGFVLPNAWDAGSARILEQVGFPAIATTSAGIAWSMGLPDGQRLQRDEMLSRVAQIVAAVAVPVTADLESGYGDVAMTVRRTVEAGAVGGNLEDQVGGELLGIDEGVEHIAAARAAAPAGAFVLNARTDTFLGGVAGDPVDETVERLTRYLDAGADCVFVPGVVKEADVRRIVETVPTPLNVVAGLASLTDAPTLLSWGVKRISLGGSLTRAAYSFLERAGHELVDTGTLGFLDGAMSYAELQKRFGA